MSKTSKFAAAFGFAPVAEDPKDPKEDKDAKKAKPARNEGESDEDYAKRCEEADKEDPKAAGAKAEGEDDKKKDDDDAKAAARAEGITAERSRWATVLSAPEAGGRGITACTLLETTDMSASAIVATLKTVPEHKAEAHGLAARMAAAAAAAPAPNAGGGEPPKPGSASATAAAIIAATAKARGEKVPA